MGAADIVPGVSGGTIALITGIYERLLGAIVAVDSEALSMALAGRWSAGIESTADFHRSCCWVFCLRFSL